MKKLIAVTAILSIMFLGIGTSQALMGVPDNVPGRDVLVPFCLISMDGFGDDNTLIDIIEVGDAGDWEGKYIPKQVRDDMTYIHITVYNIDSVKVHNFHRELTPYDMFITDGLTILGQMGSDDKDACRIDIDGNGEFDHWAFYLYVQNENSKANNNLIAHAYQVSVADGVVAAYIPPSLELAKSGHATNLIGYDADPFDAQVEAFSAQALYTAKQNLLGISGNATPDWFRLMPRYLLKDETSKNYLILWTDEEADFTFNLPLELHLYYLDEEENAYSDSLYIEHELNFIDLYYKIPAILLGDIDAGEAYASGWINIRLPDEDDNGLDADRYWLGYSLQRSSADDASLSAIFDVHRDAGVSYED